MRVIASDQVPRLRLYSALTLPEECSLVLSGLLHSALLSVPPLLPESPPSPRSPPRLVLRCRRRLLTHPHSPVNTAYCAFTPPQN